MNETASGQNLSAESLVGRIADEFTDRLDRGERPDVEEYARRHPSFAVILRDVLGALQLMRGAGPRPADPPTPAERSGCLGDFRILREVGRGGMGVVYEAEQISLARRVALKVLPFAAALDARQLQRFRNEAQAAAHLHHTNIVPVFGVGCERGVHYYAMQLIDGQTLAALILGLRIEPGPAAPPHQAGATQQLANVVTVRSATGPEFFRTVARLGVQAAEALEHAHQMGVVHRDVKPANLLLDGRGHLWVTDFGLARLQNDAGLTLSGDLLGTLRYMSPEQARGKPDLVDHRTDVYSLGASLYELLTREPPFRAADRAALLRATAEDEPTPPRRHNRAVPAELETIVLKALAKSPAERYATAGELADDLRRFLDDKPIRARRPTAGQRLRRWGRRHRAAVRAAAAAACVAVVTVVLGLTLSNLAITTQRDRARKAEADRTRQLYDSLIAQAQANRLSGRLGGRADALRALAEAAGLAPGLGVGPDQLLRLRNEVIAARTMPDVRLEKEWGGYPRGTRALAFDPELRRYARCDPAGTVTVRRVADDYELARLDGAAPPGIASVALTFGPGEEYLAVVVGQNDGGSAAVWDLGRRRICLPLPGAVAVDFCPTGRRVAVRQAAGPVRVVELATGREITQFTPGFSARSPSVRFDPHGRLVAVLNNGGREVEIWHPEYHDRPVRRTLPGPAGGLDWHPAGRELAIGAGENVLLWRLGDDRPRATLAGHHSGGLRVAFSPDGGLLASTSDDSTVRLWNPRTGRHLLTTGGTGGVWFGRDRLALANGTRLAVLRIDPPDGVRTLYWPESELGIAELAVGPDGRLLAATGYTGVRFWDLASGADLGLLPIGRTSGVGFDPAGAYLITGGHSPLYRWPITPSQGPAGLQLGPPESIPYPVAGPPDDITVSRDGRTVVAHAGYDVFALDLPGPAVRLQVRGPVNLLRPVISPDRRWVVAGCRHGLETRVWDARTKAIAHSITYPITAACRVLFSPDSQLLVAGTETDYVGLAADTWRPVWAIPRENGGGLPGVIAFSPDGRLLAVAHSPLVVKLYRADTAEEVAALPPPDPHLLQSLTFSPNGTRLVAGTEGNRLFAWDLRAIRRELARLGLDWNLPPLPPADRASPGRVEVELGDAHPDRREAADYRREVKTRPDDPRVCNNLAWLLVTGLDELRDPAAALPLAEAAVCLNPDHVRLNTLGVVYYRLGRWRDAVEVFGQSIEAKGEATAFDTFFLAMCRHHLGERENARQEYGRAVRWMELMKPDDKELIRFRAETEALLGR